MEELSQDDIMETISTNMELLLEYREILNEREKIMTDRLLENSADDEAFIIFKSIYKHRTLFNGYYNDMITLNDYFEESDGMINEEYIKNYLRVKSVSEYLNKITNIINNS